MRREEVGMIAQVGRHSPAVPCELLKAMPDKHREWWNCDRYYLYRLCHRMLFHSSAKTYYWEPEHLNRDLNSLFAVKKNPGHLSGTTNSGSLSSHCCEWFLPLKRSWPTDYGNESLSSYTTFTSFYAAIHISQISSTNHRITSSTPTLSSSKTL